MGRCIMGFVFVSLPRVFGLLIFSLQAEQAGPLFAQQAWPMHGVPFWVPVGIPSTIPTGADASAGPRDSSTSQALVDLSSTSSTLQFSIMHP